MKTQKFDVTGMTCSACSAHVEKSVAKLQGVQKVSVNLLANSMVVEYDEGTLGDQQIEAAVDQAGYHAQVHAPQQKSREQTRPATDLMAEETAHMKRRLVVSFLFLIPLFYISMGHMMGLPIPSFLHGTQNALSFAFTQFLLALPILHVNDKSYKVLFLLIGLGVKLFDVLYLLKFYILHYDISFQYHQPKPFVLYYY